MDADLGFAGSHAVGMVPDERLRLAGAVGLALGLPVALLGLDDDERVGGDALAAAQLADADLGGDELALEDAVVADLVQGDRLRAVPASASRVTVCSNGSRRGKWTDAREARRSLHEAASAMSVTAARTRHSEGGAQPPTMSMLPTEVHWVAATSVGWS